MKYDLSYDFVTKLYDEHCYPVFEKGINPFAIRNNVWASKSLFAIDDFNDIVGITYGKEVFAFSGTTKPGKSPLLRDDVNKNGVFILAHGFYENCWHRGFHRGRYKALVQFGTGKFRGWRDKDKDGRFDLDGEIWDDVTGLNYHTTRWDRQVKRVGDFSEGCIVQEVAAEYDEVMDIIWGSQQSLYSFALFKEPNDFDLF
jgi:hypothetical protein